MSDFTPKLTSEECSLLVQIFSTGCHLGALCRPLANVGKQVDQETYDAVISIGYRVMREQRPLHSGLERITLADLRRWPQSVVLELKAVARLARRMRSCIGIGDLGLFWAKTDVYDICTRGWEAVSADQHVGELTWAFDETLDDPADEQRAEPNTAVAPPESGDQVQPPALPLPKIGRIFNGGDLIFYADRVELCGIDVCSGERSRPKRLVLELLSQKFDNGNFVAFGGRKLTRRLSEFGTNRQARIVVRDLRNDMAKCLKQKTGAEYDPRSILQGGLLGYRFTDVLTVHFEGIDPCWAEPDAIRDTKPIRDRIQIRATDRPADVPNQVSSTEAKPSDPALRSEWILAQLRSGVQLRRKAIMNQFGCSSKSAQRDLNALRSAGTIEYVGSKRSGFYQLCAT